MTTTRFSIETRGPAFDVVRQLRVDGIAADMDYEGRSLKAQIRSSNRVKAPWVEIIRGDELSKGVVKLRDLGKSKEVERKPRDLARRIRV